MKTLLTQQLTRPILYESTNGGTFGGETMKTTAKNVIREESGKILILVLVLLVVGGLLLGPLLGLMSTGLASGQVYEKKASELYAADTGVEEALWHIGNPNAVTDEFFVAGNETDLSMLYDALYGLDGVWADGINGKTVEVWVLTKAKGPAGGTYRVTSIGTTPGDSSTTIEAWIDYMPAFWGNAITTPGTIDLKQGSTADGDTAGTLVGQGTVTGEPRGPWNRALWPRIGDLQQFYLNPALPERTGCSGLVDVAAEASVGPWEFTGGGTVSIRSSVQGFEAQLAGTIYVSGSNSKLRIADEPGQPFLLDLNCQTIFVEGEGTGSGQQAALLIPQDVRIRGSGVIIAVGDIIFWPDMTFAGPDDFIFLMSLNGTIKARPSGTFYGSMAAWESVEIQSGTMGLVSRTEPPIAELEFLSDPRLYNRAFIRTWRIS